MDREPDLFTAHLAANSAAGHLLQAYTLQRYSGRASAERRQMAMESLETLVEMFGLELVPRAEVVTR